MMAGGSVSLEREVRLWDSSVLFGLVEGSSASRRPGCLVLCGGRLSQFLFACVSGAQESLLCRV